MRAPDHRQRSGHAPAGRALAALAALCGALVACGAEPPAAGDVATGGDITLDAGGTAGADAADAVGDAAGADPDGATADGAPADATVTDPDAAGDAASDDAADAATDAGPVDPCGPGAPPQSRSLSLPLGETLFFDGDDYLAFFGAAAPCPVQLVAKPAASTATITGGQRLTPDVAGTYTLSAGPWTVQVEVLANAWNADTFSNYNYAPTQPLLLDPEGDPATGKTALWVAATTSAAVQRIDLQAKNAPAGVQATAGALVPTGSWPTAIAVWPGTPYLLVAQTGRDSVGFVDRGAGRLVDAIRVGNEPHNLVVDGGDKGAKAWIVLAGEDRVVRLDLQARAVDASVEVGHEPRALALDAKARLLFVGSLISGNGHPLGPKQGDTPLQPAWQRDVVVIDVDSAKQVALLPEVGTINRGMLVADGGAALLVATTRAHNTKLGVDAETRPHAHHLIRVGVAALLQGQGAAAISAEVDLDKQPSSAGPAASPYSLATSPDGAFLLATLSASKAILFLQPKSLAEVGRVPTGHDPRGLAFALGRAWTYAWLSNQVEGVELPVAATDAAGELVFAAKPGPNVVVSVGADPTPADVRAGQQIFNDAAFSKYGDFSCNNCHVDGLSDGLVWDLLVDGPVNTLAFRNIGGTEPFLWGGQLPTLFDFSREVLKLVGAQASGKQMEQLTRYMQSVTAPPNPHALPGGKLSAEALHGRDVFFAPTAAGGAACGACHAGPLGTSGQTVEGKTKGKQTDIPSLLGVYDTAPYGREGQWFTLGAMIDYALDYTGAKLSAADRDAVLAFVRQLPGDLLTLNSARPLAGADHVWKEVEPELVFSHVLAKGQEAKFQFVQIAADGKEVPVAGAWTLSGRVARFQLAAGALAEETKHRIDVAAGLQGAFDQQLPSAIAIQFATGGVPAFDMSGKWRMTLSSPTVGKINVNVAILQATGGKFTGVVLDDFEEGNVGADAITGVVSGTTAQLEPFYVDSQFGKFFVKDGFASTMEDADKDGFADKGAGSFDFKFGNQLFPIAVSWKRLALPKG